jgi:hypothetical protein
MTKQQRDKICDSEIPIKKCDKILSREDELTLWEMLNQ